jgi:GNAT superfamily N-acetyltransferase
MVVEWETAILRKEGMKMDGAEGKGTTDIAAPGVKTAALTPGLIEQTTRMLVDAFKSEEATSYHLDTRQPSTLRRMGLVYGILLRLFLEAGRPVLVALRDGKVAGALILTDPRIHMSKRRIAVLLLPNLLRILPHVAGRPLRSLRIMAATRHPKGLTKPYFTVEMLGVHPDHQGKGVGGMLLRAIRTTGEDDPLISGIYLNTASEGNRAFYENRGFDTLRIEDLGEVKVYHMFWQNPAFG